LRRSCRRLAFLPGPLALPALRAPHIPASDRRPLIDHRPRNRLAGLLAVPLVLSIGVPANADTRRLLGVRIKQHHVRYVERSLNLNTTGLAGAAPAKVLDDNIHALNHHAIILRQHLPNLACLAAITAADDDDFIAAADLAHCSFSSVPYRTSGA